MNLANVTTPVYHSELQTGPSKEQDEVCRRVCALLPSVSTTAEVKVVTCLHLLANAVPANAFTALQSFTGPADGSHGQHGIR